MEPLAGWTQGHQAVLHEGGTSLFPAMVAAIDAAHQQVLLESYIVSFKGQTLAVMEALERAATRGVEVCVLFDGVGSQVPPQAWQLRWSQAGVQWQIFAPGTQSSLLIPSHWRRLHRKLLVVDQRVAFCGGINLLDDHLTANGEELEQPRLDFALEFKGPLVASATRSMVRVWWRLKALQTLRQGKWRNSLAVLRAQWRALNASRMARHNAPSKATEADRAGFAMLWVERDNLRHRTQIERAYLSAIRHARESVVLAHAYFVPGQRLRRALRQAARRGVQVTVLIQGQFENFMQYHVARPIYPSLLRAGVNIVEYRRSDLHAKVAVIDGRWLTVGSSNLDPLSLLLAREANVWVDDEALAGVLQRRLLQAVESESTPLDYEALAQRSWRSKLADWLAFGIMRVALVLMGKRY